MSATMRTGAWPPCASLSPWPRRRRPSPPTEAAPGRPDRLHPVRRPEGPVELLKQDQRGGPLRDRRRELKKDENYANTSEDVEPSAGTSPSRSTSSSRWSTGEPAAPARAGGPETVKIGFIGPIMSTVSVATGGKSHEEALGVPMLQGARLAIEEWNARGGYLKRKIPFELVVSNDNGLWGSSGNEIIKQAYKDEVWGILGTIDGANSHIAIRVALKAEVVMMNTGDTDPTFIETNIPWVTRVIGDDRQQAYLLIDYWYRKLEPEAGRDHPVEQPLRPIRRARDARQRAAASGPVPIEMAYKVGQRTSARGRAAEGREARRGGALGRRGRGGDDPQPDARDGDDAAVLRVRPHGVRRVREIAGKNAEGVVAASPGTRPAGPAARAVPQGLPRALRRRSRRPTRPTPTTA